MRKLLIAAFAMSGLMLSSATFAADKESKDDKGWNGVLIDSACGAKQKSEDDAVAHPKSCVMKPGCMKSGLGLFKGDTFIKFDEKGQTIAKEYLAKDEHGTKVHVAGKLSDDGKTIMVSEIHPQDKAQKSEDEKGDKDKDDKKKEKD
jgi:hypothetical protein